MKTSPFTCHPVRLSTRLIISAVTALALSSNIMASSHREAPFISGMPKLDGSDFYMFRSYEAGREGYITFIANYHPLQDAYGGPNYFDLETEAVYEIHIDNNGDSKEDLTFSFDFTTLLAGVTVPVGNRDVAIPLINAGGVGPDATDTGAVNSRQEYTLSLITGDRRDGIKTAIMDDDTGSTTFRKPVDNIGSKSIQDYASYANSHIYPISMTGCANNGRVFVGQRQEGFAVNLGAVFDLVNLNLLGAVDAVESVIADKNVTSIALEIPISCLTDGDPVIGAWTTASVDNGDGSLYQVSRLGYPLMNELVIGIPDKDKFNSSEPVNDAQFVRYVTNPTLPFLLELLFSDAGAVAPNNFPRLDLIKAISGVDGLNTPENVLNGSFPRSAMLRLNTSTAVVDVSEQSNLGVLANDVAGFPNGRRPGDDIVDIILRVVMGALISDASIAPNNTAPFTDQSTSTAADFSSSFPYLNSPLAGAGSN